MFLRNFRRFAYWMGIPLKLYLNLILQKSNTTIEYQQYFIEIFGVILFIFEYAYLFLYIYSNTS